MLQDNEQNITKQNWKKSITLFLTAQTISLFGSSLVQYAIIWYITLSTSSGKMLTIATLSGFVPQILISFFAGVWIDKYNRKKLIIFSDLAIASSTFFLALAFILGYKNIQFLFLVLIIRSAGTGIQTPAINAILPQIVPQEYLMKINGINSTLASLMMFLAPAISGLLLSIATLETILLVDVLTAIIGISITSTILIKAHEKKTNKNSHWQEIKSGFAYLKENLLIKRLLSFQLTILFLISPSAFLTPLMVSRTFGSEVWRLTASEMCYSLGMILGGLLMATWGGFQKKIKTTLVAGTIYGILMLGLGIAPAFILYLLANMLIGITAPCYNAPITVTIQEQVPSAMQGRVFSFMQIASSSALPMGMLVFGPLADSLEVQNILIFAGLAVVLVICYIWKTKYLYFR